LPAHSPVAWPCEVSAWPVKNLHAAADNVIPRRREIVMILVVWGVLR